MQNCTVKTTICGKNGGKSTNSKQFASDTFTK